MTLSVGQLAKQTGLTVRTLHHYDQIGLLRPSRRSAAGYRLYDDAEVERLTRILILRRIGLSLKEIARVLAQPDGSLKRSLARQISHLKQKIAVETRLVGKLESIHERLGPPGPVSVDRLTTLMEMLTMFDKYYTTEQLDYLEKRKNELGEERIRNAEAEWPRLIARVREEMDKGTDPESETVKALAQRWQELVEAFTGGDTGIAASLGKMYGQEDGLHEQMGFDRSILEYVARAAATAEEQD